MPVARLATIVIIYRFTRDFHERERPRRPAISLLSPDRHAGRSGKI